MLNLFDFAINVGYCFLSAMKSNSENPYLVSERMFRPKKIKNISPSYSFLILWKICIKMV